MTPSYQIDATKCLILSDIHQDISWAKSIIEKEKGNYDCLILNGDFFDTHKNPDEVAGAKETTYLLKDVINGDYGPYWINAGNHDLHYAESWKMNQKYRHKKNLWTKCSGFSNNKSLKINKILTWDDWGKFNPFCHFGNYLIIHGGLHPNYWNFYKTEGENLDSLFFECKTALNNICESNHWSFEAGKARDGNAKFGSIYWLDFDEEFKHIEGIPRQITGHTRGEFVRVNNGSYCLDTGQNTYGLLDFNGKLEIKSKNGKPAQIVESEFKSVLW